MRRRWGYNGDMKWLSCEQELPPKDSKFLFYYRYGMGLGNWGQTSRCSPEMYVLVLWPTEIASGIDPMTFSEQYIKEMNMFWSYMPTKPKDYVKQ
jgi:hypothetical protein